MRALALLCLAACSANVLAVRGTLTKVERNEAFEASCSALAGALFHCADSPRAYDALLVTDSASHGAAARHLWIMFFAPYDNVIPRVGWEAVWLLHRRDLFELARCHGQGAAGSYCPHTVGWTLDSDGDIRPRGQWRELLDSLGDHR